MYTIQQLFSTDDTYAILSIPLSSRLPGDRFVWAYTPNGEFTVRSAYKVIMAISPSSNSGTPSDCWKRSTFWKTVWGLHVPNKIKAFTWWVCKNILPTKVNLCYRRVIDNPVCEACGLEAESSARVLAL